MLSAPSDRSDGGLVFVSYSHADAAWAQWFGVMLKPLLRSGLQVWDDTQIRATRLWHPEIDAAIERSTVALLLVTMDYLASDFVMNHELPALRQHGVPLAPVLVGDCYWEDVPELAEVQWLHDPRRDGALGLYETSRAERNRRIRLACDELRATLPSVVPAHSGRAPDPAGAPAAPLVSAVPEGHVLGTLVGVPELPLGYVVRDELHALVDVVTSTGAVAVVAAPGGVGLHGRGGIGKSVLAAALARDARIRRRFPDGVQWLTVGERPDLLALQLGLLNRLGARAEARTITEATAALRTALAHRRVLLVVDDVWSDAAAQAFRVAGAQGRVLYTSRDQRVVVAAGAVPRPVGVLSPAAARTLATEVLGGAALPEAADRAFAQVGHVALAVALLAAAVHGGRAWEQVAAELARGADVYGTHPYADTFRALHVAATTLPDDLRAALLRLAVFPPDTAIPIGAVARYWRTTPQQATAMLHSLAAARVLQRDGDTVGFHDLAHEYLLLHADGLPTLHADLLAAHTGLLDDPGEWWQLPLDEPYLRAHLAAHLAGAGDRLLLARTVTDPAYQARRIACDGPRAGEADLAIAARLLPVDPVIAWWSAWLARHAHLFGGRPETDARPARVAATVLAWLEADPSRPAAVRPARLTPLLPRLYLAAHGKLHTESSALMRVLAGHTGAVRAVAWSPDGTRLATTGSDGTIQVWDSSTGTSVLRLVSHIGWVQAVTWSVDGTRLATTGDDATIRIWDSNTGATLLRLTGHVGWVKPVAWSPDGTRLASAGTDGAARIWDPTTGAVLMQLVDHPGEVQAVVWSPDGTRLATAGDDRTIRIWDPTTGERLLQLTGHTSGVLALTWSPDGTRLASAGADRTARTWDPTTGEPLLRLTGHINSVLTAAWSPDGTRLATAGIDGISRIWDTITGQPLLQLTSHVGGVQAVAWSPEGSRLATAGDDGTARIWDPAIGSVTSADDGIVTVAAWSPDGARLATGAANGAVRIAGPTGTITLADRLHQLLAVAWSPDGRCLATAEAGRTVRLWATETGAALETVKGPSIWVRGAAWSPDGTLLATGGNDMTAYLYELGVARWRDRPTVEVVGTTVVGTLAGFGRRTNAVAWSPDGTRLATASGDRKVRLWDPRTGRMVAAFEGHIAVRAVAWSPDGSRLASAGTDRTLQLWDPSSGEATASLHTGHADAVHSVAWSSDGAHLATADHTGLVIVWDRELREVASLQLKPSQCLAWSAPLIAVGQPGRPAILALRDPADLA